MLMDNINFMGCKSVLKYKNTDIINGAKEIINP